MKRGRPKGIRYAPKPGSRLEQIRQRASLIKSETEAGRARGWSNSRILSVLKRHDPAISLDMVNKAVAALVKEGKVANRQKGAQPGMKPATRAKHLRIIDWRLQGESYEDIAFAEGVAVATVKVILNRNHVRKGSIEKYQPFDPARLRGHNKEN